MKKAKNAVQPGAPALEKGLDLLEALAAESRGLSQKQLAERSAVRSARYSGCWSRWNGAAMSRAIPRRGNIP